jgi:hypothetical protein
MFIFTEENIGNIKNAVYSNDGVPNKHAKKIEEIKDGLFKEFNYSKYKVKFPPKNTSMIVYNELHYLKDLPEDDKYVKEHDDIEKVFEEVCKKNNLEYPKKLVKNLLKSAAGVILDLKYIHNRPRPFQLSPHYNIKLGENILESMYTPSYPSGHSIQGILIGKVLQTKLPITTDSFIEAGKRISYSRNVGRAHFPSDSKVGEDIGTAMYEFIKEKL